MATWYDSLFRFTFGQPEHARSLLRWLLPNRIARKIDWATLQACPTTNTGPKLRLHHGDLLFQARLIGSGRLVYFLIEHKSGRVTGLVRQLVRYVVHIVFETQRSSPGTPYVVPVVVHHGRRRLGSSSWRSAARRLAADPDLSDFDPRLLIQLGDLAGCSEQDLLGRPLTALACLTLLCLQFLPGRSDEEVLAALVRWSRLLRAVDARRDGQLAKEQLSSYILHLTDLTPERLSSVVAGIVKRENEGSVMSTADKLRAEGRAEGKAEALLRLLTTRFGKLPARFDARVRTATIEQLERWLPRVLDAKALADVFADA